LKVRLASIWTFVAINLSSLDEPKQARDETPEAGNVGEEWSPSHKDGIELGISE
jgi:hypothetical protein